MTPTPTRPEPTTPLDALKKCAETFRLYEQLHLSKPNGQGWEKAKANAEMAEMCERALKQHLTSEPAGPQSHDSNVMFDIAIMATAHQPDDAMFSISFKDLRRLNATIQALETALLAASTGARGAVVEEIAKRHEAAQEGYEHTARESGLGYLSSERGPQAHQDRGVLLALIGAKQP